jgi:hypothetical protein
MVSARTSPCRPALAFSFAGCKPLILFAPCPCVTSSFLYGKKYPCFSMSCRGLRRRRLLPANEMGRLESQAFFLTFFCHEPGRSPRNWEGFDSQWIRRLSLLPWPIKTVRRTRRSTKNPSSVSCPQRPGLSSLPPVEGTDAVLDFRPKSACVGHGSDSVGAELCLLDSLLGQAFVIGMASNSPWVADSRKRWIYAENRHG